MQRPAVVPVAPPAPTKQIEEEDDLQAIVPQGAPCKRVGCKVTFVSNEKNRVGDGPGTKCVYHPGAVRKTVSLYMHYRTDVRPPTAYLSRR